MAHSRSEHFGPKSGLTFSDGKLLSDQKKFFNLAFNFSVNKLDFGHQISISVQKVTPKSDFSNRTSLFGEKTLFGLKHQRLSVMLDGAEHVVFWPVTRKSYSLNISISFQHMIFAKKNYLA